MTLKIEKALENVMLEKAAKLFVDRQNRDAHPNGEFDNAKRWYPSKDEKCECCENLRSPSRAYPYSLMVHCRTAKHIANLYDVPEKELKRLAKTL